MQEARRFTFFGKFAENMRRLPTVEDRKDFAYALVMYGAYGEVPDDLSDMADMMAGCFHDDIDNSAHRCAVGAQAGKKSGEVRSKEVNEPSLEGPEIDHVKVPSEPIPYHAMPCHTMPIHTNSHHDRLNQEEKPTDFEHDAKISEVISYLNEKTGKNFRPKAKANRSFVSGRLADGFTVDDCKRVIDTKAAQWMGDARMSAYLRPSTLFSQSKFEAYLNEGPSVGDLSKIAF